MKSEDTLSAQEIDALMSAVRTGLVGVTSGGSRQAGKVVPYNFRRPSRVSKEQMRALGVLHDEFAKLAATSLSGMLRTIVDLELESLEQTAYSEYVGAIGPRRCTFVFNMDPLKGSALLELNPAVAFVIIDRLLGGQGINVPEVREFTEIERAVVERVGLRMMIDLQHAWQPVRPFTLRLLNLETNPHSMQATSPNEVILVASLRLRLGGHTGAMTIGYPYLLLDPVLASLGAQRWMGPTATPRPAARSFMLGELAGSPLTVRAFLGLTRLTVRQLLNLQPGQLIPIETDPQHPVRVDVNDIPKFVGRPGAHHAHLAVEVAGLYEERSEDR